MPRPISVTTHRTRKYCCTPTLQQVPFLCIYSIFQLGRPPTGRMKLPLPPDFFRCPPLSRQEIEKYHALGRRSVESLVNKSKLTGGPYTYTPLADESDIKIHRAETTVPTHAIVCAKMEASGTLEAAFDLYRCETTDEAKAYVRRFGRTFVDAVTLYTIISPTPDRPFDSMQIKWMACKSPFDAIIHIRDYCLLESTFEVVVDGQRGWATAFRSITLECVPLLRESVGLVRAFHYDSGRVFVQAARPGYVDMTYFSDTDVAGSIPVWATDPGVRKWALYETLKNWCRSLLDVNRFLCEDRLRCMPYLRIEDRVPFSTRKTCHLCTKTFGPLRSKSHCYTCGEVVCKKCNGEWSIPLADGTFVTIWACFICSLKTRSTHSSSTLTQRSNESKQSPLEASQLLEQSQYDLETTSSVAYTDDDQSNYSESIAASSFVYK
ncbi:Aste57867_657 [Aphanomyces stellatus]|uniref:Aste57867_657 protein n=1 Tax=Aphanomyces stellatus TaxID=120398 RepID=A0A485K5U6_9STRA|nr:hypothetical protein As57867_000656 [Aphanomyces stellatus]VFT77882.1 Aste57867_657 [Aphanomyces stellatus]